MFAVLAVAQRGPSHAVLVIYRDYLESDVERLLDELCIKLGFCLPPDEKRRFEEAPPGDVDSFTDAVFEAEGIGDMSHRDIRRQVREVVDRHMSRWAADNNRGNAAEPGEGWWSPH
jgi:hypothetical protein